MSLHPSVGLYSRPDIREINWTKFRDVPGKPADFLFSSDLNGSIVGSPFNDGFTHPGEILETPSLAGAEIRVNRRKLWHYGSGHDHQRPASRNGSDRIRALSMRGGRTMEIQGSLNMNWKVYLYTAVVLVMLVSPSANAEDRVSFRRNPLR